MIWFVPTTSGDFRLIADGPDRTKLMITDPTEAEQARLRTFIIEARARGWVDPAEGFKLTGRTVLWLNAPLTETAAVLIPDVLAGTSEPWTAVRSTRGTVRLLRGRTVMQTIAEVTAAAETPEAVATVRPPRRGCPPPLPTNRRASQVLAAFSTAPQIASWQQWGRMTVYGNETGQAYTVWHRTEAHRRGLGHIVTDRTGREICVWDDTIPAEEEVLACKLGLEHAEGWVTGEDLPRAIQPPAGR